MDNISYAMQAETSRRSDYLAYDPQQYERNVRHPSRSIIQPHVIPYKGSTLHQPQRRTVIEIVSLQHSKRGANFIDLKKYHIRSQLVF